MFASNSQMASQFSGIDLAQLQVGAGLPARPENNFTPFATTTASFGSADQRMTGSMLTTDLGIAGAHVHTRADASLASDGSAAGLIKVGTSNAFSFSLGRGETMTIAFSAHPFTQAIADGGAKTYANAHLSWSISLLDVTLGATVFDFAPEQLNAMADVAGADRALTYSPGWLMFSATTGMLDPAYTYQITISQSHYAGALQSHAIPEPDTLAVLAVGLLAVAALCRRR